MQCLVFLINNGKENGSKCLVTCTMASMSQVFAVSFMITFKLFTLLWPSELT